MFDEISPTYDFINHLLSFGADIYWRRKMIEHLPKSQDIRLLDLATGTGDQLITIVKRAKQVKTALGIDLSLEMIRCGQKKIIDKPFTHRITLMEGDATDISLEKESVECVTISFGIRNMTKMQQCLDECHRVLTPCGKLLILEFSLPKNRIMKGLHLFYLRHVLPYVAGWISRKQHAYRYLNETVETFPYGEEFCKCLTKAGFFRVKAHPLTFGVVTLYSAEKLPCTTEL
ncbi:MAG: Demethylmenaquinone methyltransferase [Chlamydiae bacterium]|nr:Demethylmenaquinone methyltransferase [Chlamydiota bacterium]